MEHAVPTGPELMPGMADQQRPGPMAGRLGFPGQHGSHQRQHQRIAIKLLAKDIQFCSQPPQL